MIYVLEESEIDTCADACLYFYATWLLFHKKMTVLIDKMEDLYPNVKFYAIDIDHMMSLKKAFDIRELPTLVLIQNGAHIKNIVGVPLVAGLRSNFNSIYNN
jgi:thioredoxin-like negative regulator of GroEL